VGLAAVRETAARRALAHLHSICRACAHAPQEPTYVGGGLCVMLVIVALLRLYLLTCVPLSCLSLSLPRTSSAGDPCVSLECPVYFERCRQEDRLLDDVEDLNEIVVECFGEGAVLGDGDGDDEGEGTGAGAGRGLRLRLEGEGEGEAEEEMFEVVDVGKEEGVGGPASEEEQGPSK
jgi:hypothetical protein